MTAVFGENGPSRLSRLFDSSKLQVPGTLDVPVLDRGCSHRILVFTAEPVSECSVPMNGIQRAEGILWRFKANVASLLGTGRVKPNGIGLALSGGVDSMALAWLWHVSMKPSNAADDVFAPYRELPFRAIIINHKLRPESERESFETRDRFYRLTGREASIVELDWDLRGEAPPRSGIETSARRLRYRALGKICRDHDLNILLTGHHADDNAETVLLRLANWARGVGLRGILPLTPIPDCEDLYGISQSLPSKNVSARGPVVRLGHLSPTVHLMRPLLPFSKTDLNNVCVSNGIEWAEDRSNADVTLTGRNAVRHFLQSDVLPTALRKDSILELAASKSEQQVDEKRQVQVLHHQTKKLLNLSSGVLSIILPKEKDLSEHSNAVRQLFIRDLISVVSSRVEVPFRDCEEFARELFTSNAHLVQELISSNTTGAAASGKNEPVKSISKAAGGVVGMATIGKDDKGRLLVIWHFTREAFTRTRLEKYQIPLVKRGSYYETPDSPRMTRWDGRYWINIRLRSRADEGTNSQKKFVIRPLMKCDLDALRQDAQSEVREEISSNALRALKRWKSMRRFGKMILALPVVAEADTESQELVPGKMVAMPTIDYIRGDYGDDVQIQIAYNDVGAAGDGMSYQNGSWNMSFWQ